ncbi:MAG: glycine-rich domain-containing protein [Candidatus Thiodiazotropha sp.]
MMFLAGVPGKLKKLLDRITVARADNLDNIDAATMAHLDADVSSVGKVRKTQVFTTSGTFPRPTGVDSVHVLLVGAGAGGGGVSADTGVLVGGGGGGGQVIERDLAITGNLTITIGAGGGGGVGGNAGSAGGDSTLAGGAALTAYGGGGGAPGSATTSLLNSADANGNTGGAGGGGTLGANFGGCGAGAGRSPVAMASTSSGGYPGASAYGNKGSMASDKADLFGPLQPGYGLGGYGGGGGGGSRYQSDSSIYGPFIPAGVDGGGDGARGTAGAGGDAVANTGGGGGGAYSAIATAYNGGDGADGLCVITWFE